MFPNKTISINIPHHLLTNDPLSHIQLTRGDLPIFNLKQSGYQYVLPKNKSNFPLQTKSYIKRKQTKPKLLNLKKYKRKFNIERIIVNNLTKYNTKPSQYKTSMIQNILYDEKTHFVSTFKDYLYLDDDGEFLKRFYYKHEQKRKMNQILTYYFTVYNINELYSINFLSYFNRNLMSRYYFRKFHLTTKFNDEINKENDNKNKNTNVINFQYEEPLLKHTKLLSRSMTLTKVNLLPFELVEDNNHYEMINNNYIIATQTTQENTKNPTNSIYPLLTRNNSLSIISNEKTIESLINNLGSISTKEKHKKGKKPIYTLCTPKCNANDKKKKSTSTGNNHVKKIQIHKRTSPLDQCLVFTKTNLNYNFNKGSKSNIKKKIENNKVTQCTTARQVGMKYKVVNVSKKIPWLTERTISKKNDCSGSKNFSLFQNLLFYPLKTNVTINNNVNKSGKTFSGKYKSGGNSLSKNRICNTTRNNTNNKSNNNENKKKTKNLKLISAQKIKK